MRKSNLKAHTLNVHVYRLSRPYELFWASLQTEPRTENHERFRTAMSKTNTANDVEPPPQKKKQKQKQKQTKTNKKTPVPTDLNPLLSDCR